MVSGMAYCSLAHKPKSINLQRSLQKGRKALLGENSDNLLQLGQATIRFFVEVILLILILLNKFRVCRVTAVSRLINYRLHSVNVNSTSCSYFCGFCEQSSELNRMLMAYLLALTSGKQVQSSVSSILSICAGLAPLSIC